MCARCGPPRRSRLRIQAGAGDPLPDLKIRREQDEFAPQGNGAGGGDAGDAVELLEAFLEERIAGEELERLAS